MCNSKYLEFIPVSKGTIVANILTRGMYLLDNKKIKNVDDFNLLDNDLINKLKENMVCMDDVNENALMRYILNKFRYNNDNKIIITDAYTFDCNFACVYCLQQNIALKSPRLKPEERVKIWKILKDDIFHVNYLDIALFGGEPFYDPPYVDKLLNTAHDEIDTLRNISAVTNGGFSKSVIDIIKKYDFKYLQITLDGPKDIHDKRRFFKGSRKGTWDVIHQNIHRVLNETKTNILINTVIDSQNWRKYGEMLDYMIKNYKKWIYSDKPRIIFNLGMENHPYGFSEHSKKYIPNYKEYAKMYVHSIKEAAKRELTVADFMGTIMCSLNKDNEMLLGPDGAVYKCVSGLGIPAFRVASKDTILNNPERFIINYSKFIEGLKPARDCLSCKYFPICGGGCYYNAYIKNKKYDCWIDMYEILFPETVKVLYNAEEVDFDIYKLHGWVE